MSLHKIVLFLLLVSSIPLHAATEFPNGLVPADIVREFARGAVYQSLPDNFPAILLPANLDLHLRASVERNQYSQQILLRSSLSREALREGLLAALTVQGWIDISSTFIIGSSTPLNLCHNQHGSMTISTTASGGMTSVDVSRSFHPGQLRTSCTAQRAENLESAALYSFFNSRMPVLTPPASTVAGPTSPILGVVSGSFFSDRFEFQRNGSIEVPDTSAAEVHEHYATQLRTQGWQMDSSDTGEISGSSVWTRSVTAPGAKAPTQLLITFSVLRGTGNFYGVDLTLRTPPNVSSGLGYVNVTPF